MFIATALLLLVLLCWMDRLLLSCWRLGCAAVGACLGCLLADLTMTVASAFYDRSTEVAAYWLAWGSCIVIVAWMCGRLAEESFRHPLTPLRIVALESGRTLLACTFFAASLWLWYQAVSPLSSQQSSPQILVILSVCCGELFFTSAGQKLTRHLSTLGLRLQRPFTTFGTR